VFKPAASRLAARRIFGAVLAVAGLVLGGLLLAVGLLLTPVFLEAAKTNHGALWGLMVPGAGRLLLVGLGGGGALLALIGTGDRVRLNAESIAVTRRGVTTTLALRDITAVGASFVRDTPRVGHWELVITADSGGRIDLGIAHAGYLAIFDVQPILNALLSRLPAGVQVDERVRQYAATGQAPI
jgi:hypothetical protein